MAKRHSRKSQEPKRLVHKLNTIGSRLRITKTVGSIVLLKAMAEKMGIRALVDSLIPMEREVGLTHGQVVEAMVINRCHAPVPLYEMDAWCNSSGYSDLCGTNSASYNDDRNRSALDVLSDYTVDLQANLVMHMVNTFQIPTNDVLYDLTSLYFEGDYDESQLVDYGYSRDQKPDKKQVNLGLTTTKQGGIPLYSQTLKGNTSDPATVEDNANALRRVLHRSNFLQITDGGMLTPANVHILEQQGIEFLAPWQADTAILDILESHPIEWTEMPYHSKKGNDSYWATELGIPVVYKEPLVDQPSPERSSGQRGKLPKYQVQNHIHWERAIIIRSSTKQALDAKTRSKHQQKITEALNNIGTGLNKRRLKTRVQVETKFNMLFSGNLATYRNCLILDLTGMDGEMELTWSWNDEAIKRLEARDGIYILLTNRKDPEQYPPEWALKEYKERNMVEQRIRDLKNRVKIRPLFVHTDQRIQALVLITVVALQLYSLIEWEAAKAQEEWTIKFLKATFSNISILQTQNADGSIDMEWCNFLPHHIRVLETLGLHLISLPDRLEPFT